MFHEYPKAMYRDGVYMAVASKDEEDACAVEGWTDWHADQARMSGIAPAPQAAVVEPESTEVAAPEAEKRKPGRPRKA